MSSEATSPVTAEASKKARPIPKPSGKSKKKNKAKRPARKPVAKDLNKSEEVRKLAAKMKAAGQKVRPSLIVVELLKRGVKVAPAQVSMVLRAMGFRRLRRRKKAAGVGAKANAPASAAKVAALGIDELLAVKKVVDALGGSDRAVEAIQVLKRLGG